MPDAGERYLIAPAARQDLLDIVGYSAADNPAAGARVRNAMLVAFDRLADNPGIGHDREDLTRQPVRFWTVLGRYSIVYRSTDDGRLEVARVLGPGRDAEAFPR